MIKIKKSGSLLIEFKNGPALDATKNCMVFAMEILNLSRSFDVIISKSGKPGKKMEKTKRIRTGITRYVNKTGVPPKLVDVLICKIRQGKINHISAKIGAEQIDLYPNSDIADIVTNLMIPKTA